MPADQIDVLINALPFHFPCICLGFSLDLISPAVHAEYDSENKTVYNKGVEPNKEAHAAYQEVYPPYIVHIHYCFQLHLNYWGCQLLGEYIGNKIRDSRKKGKQVTKCLFCAMERLSLTHLIVNDKL